MWIETQRAKLDEWEKRMGFPAFGIPLCKDEAARYLSMQGSERSKLTPDECAEAAVVLAQWAHYVSQAQQREEADALLLEERVTEMVRDRLLQQGAYTPQERRALAVAENGSACEVDRQRLAAQAKAKRLAYIGNRIDKVSHAYEALANTRKRNRQFGD